MGWIEWVGIGVPAVAAASLIWTIVAHFLRRDFGDISQLQGCLNQLNDDDPLRHAYRAAVLERLYRHHFPARRNMLLLGTYWAWSLIFGLVVLTRSIVLDLTPIVGVENFWVIPVGMMPVLAILMFAANAVSHHLAENVVGRSEEVRAKYRAMCFAERDLFLAKTASVVEPKALGARGWINAIVGPKRRPTASTKP